MRRSSLARTFVSTSARALATAACALLAPNWAQAQVKLTDPDWIVTGFDSTNWNGSLLYFTRQEATALGHVIAGYADWYSSGVFRGRELFAGTLSSALVVDFTGYALQSPVGIILGHYRGTVTADGMSIVDGTWNGVSQPSHGVWSSNRAFGPFCRGTFTTCPCANAGARGNGCANSSISDGAHLAVTGTASITADTIRLACSGATEGTAVYFQGNGLANGGFGATFGDGFRCVGGLIIRVGTKANSGGASQCPEPGDLSISVRGLITATGARAYQVWYRNGASFCTASTFNVTNAWMVNWSN